MQVGGRSPEFVYIGSRAKPQRGAQRTAARLAVVAEREPTRMAQLLLRGFVVGLVFWAGSLFALSVAG